VEGLSPVIAPAYAAIIVMAGLLLGPVGSFVVAPIAFVLWLATLIIGQEGILPPAPLPGSVPTIVLAVITGLSLLFCAFMGHLATQDLSRALNDATYELIQTNRKLDDANRMKSRFLARTSHELRTPLNAIIGYTDLTLRRVYGSLTSMQEDGLRRVLSNAKRLQSLINDILDLSKIEAGEMELIASPLEIKSLLEAAETSIGETARKKGLAFSTSLAPDLPGKIIGDEIRMAQIVLNLADNAVKYTAEGQVSISITLIDDTQWQIQVTDTGRGIREEDFGRIFEEFQQVDGPVPNMQPRGTGLGLAITRHLVHSMGGEITVSSELGRGSTFTVTLPLNIADKDQAQL
jgi:signal transduction histidine kinase